MMSWPETISNDAQTILGYTINQLEHEPKERAALRKMLMDPDADNTTGWGFVLDSIRRHQDEIPALYEHTHRNHRITDVEKALIFALGCAANWPAGNKKTRPENALAVCVDRFSTADMTFSQAVSCDFEESLPSWTRLITMAHQLKQDIDFSVFGKDLYLIYFTNDDLRQKTLRKYNKTFYLEDRTKNDKEKKEGE